MSKSYKGSLSLEWYNKQKAIMLSKQKDELIKSDVQAPVIDWVNKDESLFYEINSEIGKGRTPYWVNRSDIRIKEARPLIHNKTYFVYTSSKNGSIGKNNVYKVVEEKKEDSLQKNILIKGDNLLALNSLKKKFSNLDEQEKVKCIYIDPPYNTGQAFEHYDDNLAQSEWLTLMRDRLVILHELLKKEGTLCIQLDQKNLFHIKVLLDELFGKNNFVNIFTVKTSDPSGLKTVNPSPYDSAEYILMYAKDKTCYKYETSYIECDYDEGYSKIVVNIDSDYKKWKIEPVKEYYAKLKGFNSVKDAVGKIGKLDFMSEIAEFALKNSRSVFQLTAIADDAGVKIVETREKSKEKEMEIFKVDRTDKEIYVMNGRQIYFYSSKVKSIDGKQVPTKQLTNIWTDIPYNGISNEGGVKFKESKKPEKLVKRIIEISGAKKGEIVLDCFAGSGTTLAVAHKMNMNWIGVEIGDHADTHIIPRLKSVIDGSDDTGITENVKWNGGGGFSYYALGESIIRFNKNSQIDFNWNLSTSHIEESLLTSYDYQLLDVSNLEHTDLFKDCEMDFKIGIQHIGARSRIALVSIVEKDENLETIKYEYIQDIITRIKSKFNPDSIDIFTNRGVDIAFESKPDYLEIIKVPHAIMVELEK